MKKEDKQRLEEMFHLLFGRLRDILVKVERIEDGLRNGKYCTKLKK